eukprot:749385-Hanusia_phi.AAC.4
MQPSCSCPHQATFMYNGNVPRIHTRSDMQSFTLQPRPRTPRSSQDAAGVEPFARRPRPKQEAAKRRAASSRTGAEPTARRSSQSRRLPPGSGPGRFPAQHRPIRTLAGPQQRRCPARRQESRSRRPGPCRRGQRT